MRISSISGCLLLLHTNIYIQIKKSGMNFMTLYIQHFKFLWKAKGTILKVFLTPSCQCLKINDLITLLIIKEVVQTFQSVNFICPQVLFELLLYKYYKLTALWCFSTRYSVWHLYHGSPCLTLINSHQFDHKSRDYAYNSPKQYLRKSLNNNKSERNSGNFL